MTNDTEIQKLKSEYPEFFKQFSAELLEFIFSEETSSKIAEICLENGVEDEEKIEKIAYRVTLVLFEQVPKENLTEILEKGVGLNYETAEKISAAIKQRIFLEIPTPQPVKPSPPAKSEIVPPVKVESEVEPKEAPKRDVYRESIE